MNELEIWSEFLQQIYKVFLLFAIYKKPQTVSPEILWIKTSYKKAARKKLMKLEH